MVIAVDDIPAEPSTVRCKYCRGAHLYIFTHRTLHTFIKSRLENLSLACPHTYSTQFTFMIPQDSENTYQLLNWHIPVGSPWGIVTPVSTRWILQDQMNVWLFNYATCHWKDRGRVSTGAWKWRRQRWEIHRRQRRWVYQCVCVCVPVMCWDRTSVKSGLKVPPSNISHPSVAMRPAITGALPPTAHLFPGKSREASTSSLNKVSFSIKRLQDKEKVKKCEYILEK